MDRLGAAMDRIGYEQERGIERGDQVKNWMKVMPFLWAIIINWVDKSRRGTNLQSNCKLHHPQPSHCEHLTLDICGLLHVLKGHGS